MNIAEITIKRKTISLVMSIMIIGGGIFAYQNLGRLEDPEFTIKDANIYTSYPGATAKEVAEEVTDEIETALQQLGQLELVTSISEPGLSTIQVEMKDKYDKSSLPQVWDEVRRKVNDVQSKLPPGTSPSIVYDDFGDVYGIYFAMYGDGYSYKELYEYAKLFKRELLLVEDVRNVTFYGVQDEIVYLEISRAKLAQLGISPSQINATIGGQNKVASSGNIVVGDRYIRIDPTGDFTSVDEIGDLLILQTDGTPSKLRLGDIAKIGRDYIATPASIMHFNGRPAIGVGISTVEGGNVVDMGLAVEKRIKELLPDIPLGVEIGVISNQAQAVIVAVNSFAISLIEAIAIVIAVLMIAMGLRSGILIGVILLMTVFATFILMYIKGIMLERISLGALIIALGMLVDNAIVIVEGIQVNIQRGMKRIDAAAQIVGQTMWPLLGATVVAILAFAAIGVSQDSTGEYCRSLFLVIMYSLLMSWVLAITITPLFGVMFLKPVVLKDGDDPYGGLFFGIYKSFLVFCMRFRWFTLIVLLVMLASSFYGFTKVKKSFFPPSTRSQFLVHYWLPQGTDISKTESDAKVIVEHLRKMDYVEDVATCIGQGATRFILTYSPEDKNSAYAVFLVSVDDYRHIEETFPNIVQYVESEFPDASVFCRKFILGPGDPQKIQARFRGPDAVVLRDLAEQANQILMEDPDAVDIFVDWREMTPLIRPVIAEIQARNAGITRSDIAKTLEFAYDGVPVSYYREGDEILPIIFRSPEEERAEIQNLKYLRIWSPKAQKFIPLSQVVIDFETVTENDIIRRRNRVNTITVKCDPRVGEAATVFAKVRPKIEKIKLPAGYTLEWGGEYEDSGDAQAALASKMPMTVVMMVLIVIVIFDSIKKPLIIFLTVPLALIGVTIGLLLANQPFGFMALLGFMSLSGMLIKNAVVLIDEINAQMATGKDPFLAVVDSGVSRLRPVSMAAMTTVLGMIPLVTDAFFVAMAVTIMCGLTFATVLTLVVVPVLYVCFYKVKYKPIDSQ